MSEAANPLGEVVSREEVRPGLIMVKRRMLKEDGRYLLHYDFERPMPEADLRGDDAVEAAPAANER